MKRKRAIVSVLILACVAGYLLWTGIVDENSLLVVTASLFATIAGTTSLLLWLSK